MYEYHKVTEIDCLGVATDAEKVTMLIITRVDLLKALAKRWCALNGFMLNGYLGHCKDGYCWDATKT